MRHVIPIIKNRTARGIDTTPWTKGHKASKTKTLRGIRMLKDVRNADGKLVAQVNEPNMEVIIVQRGFITTLRFSVDGTVSIENTQAADE